MLSVALLAAGAGEVDVVGVLLAALASLPLVARRAAPLAVFVLTALASAVLYGVTEITGPPVGPTVALYGLASGGDGSRARTLLTLGLVALMLAIHVTATGLDEGRFPGAELVFGVLLWGGTWLAGDRARLRRERMAELEERALRAERDAERERRLAAAEERARIARDLHDSAGHAINVILVHAGLGRLNTTAAPTRRVRRSRRSRRSRARPSVRSTSSCGSCARTRRTGTLRSSRHRDWPRSTRSSSDTGPRAWTVDATVDGERRPLPPGVDRAAYRILQEALTNAARHGAGTAEVAVAFGPSALDVTVANPVHREDAARPVGGGHGVIGMRERAAGLDGSLEAGMRDGQFRVHARLPFLGRGT